jgi:hypothetical protein
VTDDELERAVAHKCNTLPYPVVKTKHIAEAEFIDVKQQTVKRRLDRLRDAGRVSGLQVSQGWVWWVSDDTPSDMDPEHIHWESIDPDKIPPDLVEKHPEFPNPGFWEQLDNKGESIVRIWAIPFFFSLTILITEDTGVPFVAVSSDIYTAATVIFFAGVMTIALGVGTSLIASVGSSIAARGLVDDDIVDSIRDTIPRVDTIL